MKRKIGLEVEYPMVCSDTLTGLPQDRIRRIWASLGKDGWSVSSDPVNGLATGAFRQNVAVDGCLNPNQSISTDTGPLLEIAPSPEVSLAALKQQFSKLKELALQQVKSVGGMLLGLGVHPYTGDTKEEYYRLRTPRSAYDYAIKSRGWPHEKLLNVAAIQEVIDVPAEESFRAFRVLIRLCGLMMFIFRNAPDLHHSSGYLCIRPKKWLDSVSSPIARFRSDIQKVNIPLSEILNWQGYFDLLWNTSPMFLLGTKKHGLFYVPDHPTFWKFLTNVPARGWTGVDVLGKEIAVMPDMDHVNCTDWTYFGFCRPRWKFGQEVALAELIEAFRLGRMDSFFEKNATKIVIENRCNATGFPGEEFCSLAFVLGILENLDTAEHLAFQYDYDFWRSMFSSAQIEPLRRTEISTRKVLPLAEKLLSIALDGLSARGLGEENFLGPVAAIISSGVSRSELALKALNSAADKKSVIRSMFAVD